MYEVEVKARLAGFDAARSRAETAGFEFRAPLRQQDTVFARSREAILEALPGTIVCRIRRADQVLTLNLKRSRSNELDVVEFETTVDDADASSKILMEFGLQPVVEVVKTRHVAQLGPLTLCLDRVEGLGDYAELESLSESQPELEVQDELARQLRELLGPNHGGDIKWGYDRLLLSIAV